MTQSLLNRLAQQQHEALVALYIDRENRSRSNSLPVKDVIAAYERLLIDPLVTQKVTTTRVAEAIASLQLYLGRICQNLEPGLQAAAEEIDTWQGWQHRYALWSGLRKLESQPENYLDPAMRQHPTPLFSDLQQKLQQGKLTDALIQDAVLNYLKDFEEISSLQILSAFQEGDDYRTARFWFIGRTRNSPSTYYIRSLDLRETEGSDTHASVNAWGDWEKINLSFGILDDNAIRPFCYQGRLYIAWYEIEETRDAANNVQKNTVIRLAEQRLDKSWSVSTEQTFAGIVAMSFAAGYFKTYWQWQSNLRIHYAGICLSIIDNSPERLSWGVYLSEKNSMLNEMLDSRVLYDKHLSFYRDRQTTQFYPFMVQQNINVDDYLDGYPQEHYKFCGLVHQNSTSTATDEPASGETIRYMQTPADDTGKKNNYILTTSFARRFIPYAQQGMEQLFSWQTQNLTEPPLYKGVAEDPNTHELPIDFYGAYGRHFYELFLHLPWLVANTYAEQLSFEEAQKWHNRLFTPQQKEGRYFHVRALAEAHDAARRQLPNDADSLALSHPVIYCKGLFYNYIRFLMARGDALYRELTRDSLNEAKQFYMQALALLGENPQQATAQRWQPIALADLAASSSRVLRELEARFDAPLQPLQQTDASAAVRNTLFREPQNPLRTEMWAQLQTRLYNLRHMLTLDGKALTLPLYDTPINPADLQKALASGQGAAGNAIQQALAVPPFRYPVMHERALRATETLIQLGNSLLSALERKDGLDLERLQYNHQQQLLDFTVAMQTMAIEMGEHSLTALQRSREAAQARYDHYQGLDEEGFIAEEKTDIKMRQAATISYTAASGFFAAGSIAACIPNIAGMAVGTPGASQVAFGIGYGFNGLGYALSGVADVSRAYADLARRRQDWQLQRTLADKDGQQIEAQIAAQQQQNAQYRRQLAQTLRQQQQVTELLDFWSQRVTRTQLYQWLIGQLRRLFNQAWDATLSLCLATEAAWRCETGWFSEPSLLNNSGWNDASFGLLSGETLKLALLQMEQKYLLRYERHLELTHTLSLKSLLEQNGSWQAVAQQIAQIEAGTFQGTSLKIPFSLPESLFAERHPGLYQRRLIQVALSIPAVIGPYQNVCAQLTQTGSHFLLTPDLEAWKTLHGGDTNHAGIYKNLRASQQVILSSGFEDSGLFVENLSDERYLPFEGNGVHSSWELQFPNVSRVEQQQLLSRMTDIILRIRYRALDGGAQFADGVLATLTAAEPEA